jgi:hypothetical protein
MYGMGSGNTCFAFGCFGSRTSRAVVLALLGFARLKCRSTALDTRATAFGCAAQALDFSTSSHKINIHNLSQVMKKSFFKLLKLFIFVTFPLLSLAQDEEGCKKVVIVKPDPFIVSGGEVLTMSDGSVWRDQTYLYLYLYLSNPTVILCPSQSRMHLPRGENFRTFFLKKLK